jgi:hypothetical protein
LDKEDWRINFIAANLISNDAANLPDLKNKWARIYKVMSFFKGLREDLNYIQYRDSLISSFGPDYDITQLFDDKNKFAATNLEKLKTKLLTYKLSEIQGAYNQNIPAQRPLIGFKMLAESYWPNSYLFDKLTVPNVTTYLATSTQAGNITSCILNNATQRCNGITLDIINVATPISGSAYFSENANYANYKKQADQLRGDLDKNAVWQASNYWSTLSYLKAYLNTDPKIQMAYMKTSAWQDKSLNTVQAALINLQLPLESFSINQAFQGVGLNNSSSWNDNAYVEPNLNLINELLANNTMVLKMLTALQLDKEISSATQSLSSANNSLSVLKNIVAKELQGTDLSQDDKDAISEFAKQLKIDQTIPATKQLTINFPTKNLSLKGDLSHLKLMVLIHQSAGAKIISVGPVWNYQESR